MKRRVVVPEILDQLESTDPAAVRSRRDLRLIHLMMGNERWILKQVSGFQFISRYSMIEMGAGDGSLLKQLGEMGPAMGIDLAPRPVRLAPEIGWRQQDIFEVKGIAAERESMVIASLFLHHFEDAQLAVLGEWLRGFQVLCFVEPLRRPLSLACGILMLPFVNHVTRHDMPVSIRAGFVRGELPRLLGLTEGDWDVREETSWRGGIRLVARSLA